jgi:hypothetical protein
MNFQLGLSSFSSRTLAEKNRFKEVQNRDKKLMQMPMYTIWAIKKTRIFFLMMEESSKTRYELVVGVELLIRVDFKLVFFEWTKIDF